MELSAPLRVLLIEDSPTDALLIQANLADNGSFEVVHAEQLAQGLAYLSQENHIDVVLLDLGLPDSQGLSSCLRVLQIVPPLPVVVLTGQEDEDLGLQAVQAGAQDYLEKRNTSAREMARALRYAVERHRIRQELRQSEENFRLLVEGVVDYAIYRMDPAGTITTWNPGGERILGYSAQEILGQNHARFFTPEDCLDLVPQRSLEQAQAQGRCAEEGWRVRKDGSLFWSNGVLSALRDEQGKLLGFAKVVRDLTERKRAEQALHRFAETQVAILNSLPAHIALLDSQGTIVAVNEAWKRFATANVLRASEFGVGVNYLEACDRAYGECLEEATRVASGIRAVLQGKREEFALEYPCHSPQQQRWFRLMVTPVRVKEELNGVVVMHINITDRKLAELENQRLVFDLGERVKELRALHSAAVILRDDHASLAEILHQFVRLIPPAMQYPEQAAARVVVGSLEAETENYRDSPWKLETTFTTAERLQGRVQVVYLEQTSSIEQGQLFLPEEYSLFESLAELLRWHFDRRQATAALAAAERHTRLILNSVGEGVLGVDREGQIVFMNPAVTNILGCESTQVIERSLYELIQHHRADGRPYSRQDCPIHRTLSDGQVRHGSEEIFYGQAGNAIPIEYTCSPILDERGQVSGAVVTFKDISERKQAESALQQYMTLLINAQRIGNMGSWCMDLTTNQLIWSDETCRLFGITPQEFPGTFEAFAERIFPEDRPLLLQKLKEADAGLSLIEVEYRIRLPDGQVRWMYERGNVERNASGKPIRRLGMVMDVTERKQADEALRLSEERFRLVSKASNDAIWDWDIIQNTLWWNEGFEVLFGFRRDEVESSLSSWTNRIHSEDSSRVLKDLHESIERGENVWSSEYRFMRKDGSYAHVFDRGYVIRDEAGQAIRMIGGMTDLTERKSLEAQLLHSQKMEAIGQLAGGVAHDFNNLLTVISGYSELLLSLTPANDPKRSMLADIRDAGERAANLTRQLLAFSRKQILTPQILDLNGVVSNLEKMLRRLIGEDLQFTSVLHPRLPRIKVDPGQLEQVILNLAVNARDAMPRGGRLTLETTLVEITPQQAEARLECKPGSYVALLISDTGCGMPPDIQARIFEPFFTTKEPGKGTGLGLATVFGIVKQSEGHIEVISEVGVGTTFRILFPAILEQIKSSSHHDAPVRRGSETILLVEDEEGVRRIAKLALETYGYQVLVATDGREALQRIEQHSHPIDLVITDVVMPEMSGRELAEQLRQRHAGIKVIFMSGYTDDAVLRHGVVEATDSFLQKPFTLLALARKVRDLLDQ